MSWLYGRPGVPQSSFHSLKGHFKSTDEGSCLESEDFFSRIVHSLLCKRSSVRFPGVSPNPCLHFVSYL